MTRSPFQPPEEETIRDFPTSTYITGNGSVVAFPADRIDLAIALGRHIEGTDIP